jgi:hypothetical protein
MTLSPAAREYECLHLSNPVSEGDSITRDNSKIKISDYVNHMQKLWMSE